jgi:hypothetical protein
MYNYIAFGLLIQTEFPFRELLPNPDPADSLPDVIIKWGVVNSMGLNGSPPPNGLFYQVTPSNLWLHVPDLARFLVTGGHEIIIDPLTKTDEDSIRLYVLGSCMGAILMQRHLLLLHGNAIQIDNHCISFVGHSGVGKSTLAGGFFKRGYSILADDICALDTGGRVIPSFPQIKLHADTLEQLKINTQSLKKILPSLEKFAVPLGGQFHSLTSRLKMVYVLETHHQDNITITPLTGMEKLGALQNHLYRKQYLNDQERLFACLKQCMQIGSQINLARIRRPLKGFKLDELVNTIELDLQERGFMTKSRSFKMKEASYE